jgi:hypothetical protein
LQLALTPTFFICNQGAIIFNKFCGVRSVRNDLEDGEACPMLQMGR